MDFEIPKDIADFLADMDDFIERELRPLERRDDNIRFFDHRREDARTDWERGGLPNEAWEALLRKVRKMADDAGFYRYPLPKRYGGRDGTNLCMAIIREHLAAKGLGLACDVTDKEQVRAAFRRSRIIGRRFRLVHCMCGHETVEVATYRRSHDVEAEGASLGQRAGGTRDRIGVAGRVVNAQRITVGGGDVELARSEVADAHLAEVAGHLDALADALAAGEPEATFTERLKALTAAQAPPIIVTMALGLLQLLGHQVGL